MNIYVIFPRISLLFLTYNFLFMMSSNKIAVKKVKRKGEKRQREEKRKEKKEKKKER